MVLQFIRALGFRVVLGLFLTFLFWLPDLYVAYSLKKDAVMSYKGVLHFESMYIVWALFVLLTYARPFAMQAVVVGLLSAFQFTQLCYFVYSGTFYSQFAISFMLSELHDFSRGMLDLWPLIWKPLIACWVCAGCIVLCYYFYGKKSSKYRYLATVPIVLFMLATPFMQSFVRVLEFRPSYGVSSVRNGLYSWNYYFSSLFKSPQTNHYEPYRYSKTKPLVDNLVLIIGESANHERMGLFGSENPTTPYLSSLMHDQNFHFQLGFSSSVATQFSLGYFLNGVSEPDNVNQLGSKEGNLFKIGIESGFEVHFVSAQFERALSHSYVYRGTSTWLDRESYLPNWGNLDDKLLDAYFAQNPALDKPQLIVLHQQNMHVNYKGNYPKEFDRFKPESDSKQDKLRSEYDNSVLFFDHTLKNWFNSVQDRLSGRTLVLYVPDHGQNLGPERFGHGTLDFATATIPVFAFNAGGAEVALNKFKEQVGCITSHYRIHNAISSILGVEVTNPQEKGDTFFVGGLSHYGAEGWLEGKYEEYRSYCNVASQKISPDRGEQKPDSDHLSSETINREPTASSQGHLLTKEM